MNMVFSLNYWRAQFSDIVKKTSPFYYILLSFAHLLIYRVVDSPPEHQDCMHANKSIVLLEQIIPDFSNLFDAFLMDDVEKCLHFDHVEFIRKSFVILLAGGPIVHLFEDPCKVRVHFQVSYLLSDYREVRLEVIVIFTFFGDFG